MISKLLLESFANEFVAKSTVTDKKKSVALHICLRTQLKTGILMYFI